MLLKRGNYCRKFQYLVLKENWIAIWEMSCDLYKIILASPCLVSKAMRLAGVRDLYLTLLHYLISLVHVCVVKQQANAASQCHHQHQHIHLSQPNINIACRGRSLPNVNQMSSSSGIDLQVLSCVHAIHDHHHSHFRLLIPSWHAQLDLCRHTLEQTINERNSQSEMQSVEHMMWRRKTSGCCD